MSLNYSELSCKLEDYLNKYELIINTPEEMEQMVDDILKIVKESSYDFKNNKATSKINTLQAEANKLGEDLGTCVGLCENLQTQLAKAEKVIEFYSERVWEKRISAGVIEQNRCVDFGKTAREYFKDKEK